MFEHHEDSSDQTHHSRPTGELLADIADKCDHSWTIADLSAALGPRAFGIIMLIFTLPNAVPIPLPGVSTLTGIPLIFFAAQICIGRETLWLPAWIGKRSIGGNKLKTALNYAVPRVKKAEKYIKPRLEHLTDRSFRRFAGVLIIVQAALIALPIPLGNLPPGVAMMVLALAITERDGKLMIAGWIGSFFATIYVLFLISGYIWLILTAIQKFF